MKWDTAVRDPDEPHVRALSLRCFLMPVPTLAQQCATSPTLRTGGMQDIRDPMRVSTGKSTTWCKQIPPVYGRILQVYGRILQGIRPYTEVLEP